MLYEIKGTKQNKGEDFRRWFTDDFFDLFVWYDKRGKISAFQLSYDKVSGERVITWRRRGGYMHAGVDGGEELATSHMTPILVSDGVFDSRAVAEKFRRASGNLDDKMVDFIYKKILQCPPEANM
ncbi:MAG: hypothetical protein DRP87_11705 [Spirochaetes bacterium]|nr:MAG: hypothetical protein DRP87_11705 [Spirochaetota bacterium]